MWVFLKSASDKSNWLKHEQIEICFIGRSNVGKSTLINALAQNKVAHTSKTPGRTQLINYFDTQLGIIAVDLPGYGYAKMAKTRQMQMVYLVEEYFQLARPQIVFLLIDARIGFQTQDEVVLQHLMGLKHNVNLIITKCDQANQKQLAATLKQPYFQTLPFFKMAQKNTKLIGVLQTYLANLTKA